MSEGTEANDLLRGILALMIDEREARPSQEVSVRTEVLLADAGLAPTTIAQLMGKQPAAVRMAISRARKSK